MAIVKLGFVAPPYALPSLNFEYVFAELVKRSRPNLVSAPPRSPLARQKADSPSSSPDDPSSSLPRPTICTCLLTLTLRTDDPQAPVPSSPSPSLPFQTQVILVLLRPLRKRGSENHGRIKRQITLLNCVFAGIVILEIQSASDLPRLKNNLPHKHHPPLAQPHLGRKLVFHVRPSFKVQLTVLDWDPLSSNDHVGDAWLDVGELVRDAPQPDPRTGLYKDVCMHLEGEDREMMQIYLPLTPGKGMPWEAKHNPTISFREKFQPYAELHQRFWAQYLKQYDTDDTSSISHIELTSMLDSLGSTFSAQTIDIFSTRHRKPQPKTN